MGKLFGFGKSGSISLRLNKPSYVAGELVTGTIFVTIDKAIQCDALVLKVTGKEKVSWYVCHHEDGEKHRHHHDKSHEFFKQKIVICSIPSTYLPGSYTYPFEYLLPPGLPGVCELNNFHSANVEDLNATIRYKFKATLDVQGMFSKDLKDSVRLVVHEQLRQDIRPSEDSTTQTVRYLCCLNKGTCSLGVAMDKNVYFPGEVAQINVVVNNASSVDFTRMRCTLNQLVTLKVQGRTHLEREVARQAFPGVNAGLSITQSQPLALVPNLNNVSHINPSTNGAIIQCAYRLDIECDIPMCPDVELHMPITIIAPVLPDPQYIVPGSYVPPVVT